MRIVLYFHLVLLLIILFIGIDIYRTGVNDYTQNTDAAPYDAIIVPGVPYNGKSWSDVMRMRVLWAANLYKNEKASHIIFSGSDVYTPYIESEVMAAYAKELGIPDSAIYTENRAEHSTENIYYSYKIARKEGFDHIALATDPYQSYFLHYFADQHEINLGFLPFQFGMDSIFDLDTSHLNIKVKKQADFTALPDRESFFERFRGTLGKHIPRDEKNEIRLFKE